MMLFISHTGESLPVAYRMLREGTDCGVYVHSPVHARRCYEGILERVKLQDLKKAVALADVIVIDNARKNERTAQDLALLHAFGCDKGAPDVFAELWKAFRGMGKVVIGSGIVVNISTVESSLRVAGWFDGEAWSCFTCSVEDSRLMNADNGPDVGCQQCTTWAVQDEAITGLPKVHTDALKDSGYIGPVSIKGGEVRLGFSYDSLYGILSMISGTITEFFSSGFKSDFKEPYAAAERISVPPYPYAERGMLDALARNTLIVGSMEDHPGIWFQDVYSPGESLACAGSDGVIGIAAHAGKNASAAWSKVYGIIDRLTVQGSVQIRTDGPRRAMKKIEREVRHGIS